MDVDDEDIIDDDHYDTDGGTRLYHSRLILSLKDVTNQNAGRHRCIARSNGQELAKNVVVIVRSESVCNARYNFSFFRQTNMRRLDHYTIRQESVILKSILRFCMFLLYRSKETSDPTFPSSCDCQ